MRVIIELEISGDYGENLDDDEIEDILDNIIENGARSFYSTGRYTLKEIISR